MESNSKKIKVVFYGGRQAGMISLLTILAMPQFEVVYVIPSNGDVLANTAKMFGLKVHPKDAINSRELFDIVSPLGAELLFCCHGLNVIKPRFLDLFQKAINIHPCLYKYKGLHPIDRLLADGEKKASIAAHYMTEEVDAGDVIVEQFIEIESTSVVGVYNELYPLYSRVTKEALEKAVLNN